MNDSESTAIHEQRVFLQNIRQVVASSEGATLLEIILVIILLSVLTVSALPKFFDTSSITVAGAAEMVAADIRYAQELAMSSHQSKIITFSVNDTYYVIDSKTVNLPSRVTISSGDSFTFSSLGAPDAGGSVQVTAGSITKTVSVENYTGKVTIT
jgi:MSHA pilin protein MshC